MICPNLKDTAVAEQFDKLKDALGEPLAYLVWDKNGGNYLDKNSNGTDSALWNKLIKTNSEKEAILLKSKMFSESFSKDKAPFEKIKYNHSKTPGSQSREARDNAKLDITLSILKNSDTFGRAINPGNFDMLKDLANPKIETSIAAQKSLSHGNLDISLPQTNREMFTRNMTGKAILGMFVNHSVNHSIIQYTDVAFNNPIELAGLSLSSLNNTKGQEDSEVFAESMKGVNSKDLYISRMLGMWVGASADNAKEPVASDLNVSTFTVDVLSTMVRTGFSMETALYFLNQPAIVQLAENYFLDGGSASNFKESFARTRNEINGKLDEGTEVPNTISITKRDLFNNIKGGDTQQFYAQQVAALDLFEDIQNKSFELANLVRMLRPDNLGRQIRTSSNEVYQANVKEVMNESTELTGLDTLWEKYPMMKSFYDNAVIKTTEELNKWYPWNETSLLNTKQLIKDNIPGNQKLSDTQIDFINMELMNYLVGDFEFFDGTDREDIVKKFPNEFKNTIKTNPELVNNALISRLFVEDKKVSGTSVNSIVFRNSGTLTDIDKDRITNHWKQLLDDPETKAIGGKLIKYTYYTQGFYISPRSFSHLIPVEWFRSVSDVAGNSFNDYLDGLIAEIRGGNQVYSGFMHQFFRNNWQTKTYVKEHVAQSRTGRYTQGVGATDVPIGVTVSGNQPVTVELTEKRNSDLVIRKSTDEVPAGFVEYLVVPYKGKRYLFHNVEEGFNKAKYERIQPLGIKNIVKEYSRNNPELVSIFSDNSIKKAEPVKTKEPAKAAVQQTMQLKDGKTYNYMDINRTMLVAMGYSQTERNKILEEVCK